MGSEAPYTQNGERRAERRQEDGDTQVEPVGKIAEEDTTRRGGPCERYTSAARSREKQSAYRSSMTAPRFPQRLHYLTPDPLQKLQGYQIRTAHTQ